MPTAQISVMDFPTKLRMLLARDRLTNAELRRQLKVVANIRVSEAKIGRWTEGKYEPRRPELAALCRIFGVSADCLVLDELEPVSLGRREDARRPTGRTRTIEATEIPLPSEEAPRGRSGARKKPRNNSA